MRQEKNIPRVRNKEQQIRIVKLNVILQYASIYYIYLANIYKNVLHKYGIL
jgi:hypothetical protein